MPGVVVKRVNKSPVENVLVCERGKEHNAYRELSCYETSMHTFQSPANGKLEPGVWNTSPRQLSMVEDLALTLSEFDDALQDFSRGPGDSEDHLRQLKRQHMANRNSAVTDSDSGRSSQLSSLSTSEENISHSITSLRQQPKAKLGDTRELEDYIADLDKVLDGIQYSYSMVGPSQALSETVLEDPQDQLYTKSLKGEVATSE
ncbi:regulator of cell cycle RGCC [Pelodytes ibericus]